MQIFVKDFNTQRKSIKKQSRFKNLFNFLIESYEDKSFFGLTILS